ncbi:MAG: helix-turn-helix domain-containing protein, partial [Beutenbergiaceae bacterium]
MTRTVAYHWHLRKMMTDNDIHSTTKLVPLLADRGVVMTSTQVYRIVTGEPERLNMQLLAALCDIFDCTPNDLIEPYVVTASTRGPMSQLSALVLYRTPQGWRYAIYSDGVMDGRLTGVKVDD